MHVEVLCTGDELLTGLVTDTNSPHFMGKLFALGEQVRYVQVVGDVRADIIRALSGARDRADAVLVSGGLGPTADDLTAECAAAVAGVPLVEDASVLASIRDRFTQRGLQLTPNNAKQALVPAGAEVVPNRFGSAPMFILRLGRCTLFFVPGVPREYKGLVDEEVLPRLGQLLQREPGRTFRASRLLKTIGLPESHLDHLVKDLRGPNDQLTVGFRTHGAENQLKLVAAGPSQSAADAVLADAEAAARRILAEWLFGADADELTDVVARQLRAAAQTLEVLDACTGGLLAELLSRPAGADPLVRRVGVAPSSALLLEAAPAAQGEGAAAAEALARAALARSGSLGLGLCWAVEPAAGGEGRPGGAVALALATPAGVQSRRQVFLGDRERIRYHGAYAALELLWRHGRPPPRGEAG